MIGHSASTAFFSWRPSHFTVSVRWVQACQRRYRRAIRLQFEWTVKWFGYKSELGSFCQKHDFVVSGNSPSSVLIVDKEYCWHCRQRWCVFGVVWQTITRKNLSVIFCVGKEKKLSRSLLPNTVGISRFQVRCRLLCLTVENCACRLIFHQFAGLQVKFFQILN